MITQGEPTIQSLRDQSKFDRDRFEREEAILHETIEQLKSEFNKMSLKYSVAVKERNFLKIELDKLRDEKLLEEDDRVVGLRVMDIDKTARTVRLAAPLTPDRTLYIEDIPFTPRNIPRIGEMVKLEDFNVWRLSAKVPSKTRKAS